MGGRKGGVRPASAGSIEIDFYYRGVRCRERIQLAPAPRNMRYAENLKGQIENAIAIGTFRYADFFPDSAKVALFADTPGDATNLGKYLEEWLLAMKPHLKTSTYEDYRKTLRGHLLPEFGGLRLSELSRKHAKEYAAKLVEKGVSTKRIGNIFSPLRVALDDAVEDEKLDVNPLANWKIRRRKNEGRRRDDHVDPFDGEERKAIMGALVDQGLNLVQFWFWSGLRTSELVALDWPDIDFVRGVARISRALTQAADEPEEPKTDAGFRDVKLLPAALEALRRQKTHTYLKGREVFQNPRTGERWTGDQALRKTLWTPALKRAGVRYRNPYQCRHTFASMMLMAGEHVMWVAKQMGHRDWTFTARTYSRFIRDDMPEAGNKAAERWSVHGQDDAASS